MAFSNTFTDHETQLSEDETFLQALNTSSSLFLAMSFRSALELGLFEIIAKAGQGLSVAEIVAQLPTKNPNAPNMLERILRLLASYSFLSYTVVAAKDSGYSRRLYDLTPIGKLFAPNKDGVSLGDGFSVVHCKAWIDSWDKLTEAILEGGVPFQLANGVGMFEFAGRDPTFNKEFNTSMTGISTLFMKKVMQSYKGFENINQLVDVGGGVGSTLQTIISQYPHIKGINYDLPHVIEQAIPSPGIEYIAGDMFQSVPSGEVIWMKWVLHTCDDNHCIKLLKNCYKALPDNGKVIVIDTVIPEEPEVASYAKYAYISDVAMMVFNTEGKERTQKEFWSLANAAGFASVKLVCRVYFSDIMEFYK
ncbi:hypothetical protein Ancab_040132 [Ancistrocladus abbreviatus]